MKILIKAIAGSHLFGTNTPTSDQDFKGVFLPDPYDILLGKFDQTVNQSTNKEVGQKNSKEDIDLELYSLDKFLKMLYQGQTVAWELLFTPDHMILEKHPLWDEIRENSHLFLNKRVDAFIGYCKQQAHKYGIRGSRMNTLEAVLKELKLNNPYIKIEDVPNLDSLAGLEHVEFTQDKNGKNLFVVCGKKFGEGTKLQYVVQPLQQYYDEYGERSRKAKENEGIDWKALSHAVRVCMQAISLLTYHKINLPMFTADVEILKDIKAGKIPFLEVANIIEQYQDMLHQAVKDSTLPAEPNLANFQAVQIAIYEKLIKGEV